LFGREIPQTFARRLVTRKPVFHFHSGYRVSGVIPQASTQPLSMQCRYWLVLKLTPVVPLAL
jgi:hypothetical protein